MMLCGNSSRIIFLNFHIFFHLVSKAVIIQQCLQQHTMSTISSKSFFVITFQSSYLEMQVYVASVHVVRDSQVWNIEHTHASHRSYVHVVMKSNSLADQLWITTMLFGNCATSIYIHIFVS